MTKTGFPGNQVQGVRTMGKGNPAGSSNGAGRLGGGTSGARKCSVGTAALGGGTTQGRTKSRAIAEAVSTRSRTQGRIPLLCREAGEPRSEEHTSALPIWNGGIGRRHYPGADEVPSDCGSGQHEEQDARSHTVIMPRGGRAFHGGADDTFRRRNGSRAHSAFNVLLFRLPGYSQVIFELEAKPGFG